MIANNAAHVKMPNQLQVTASVYGSEKGSEIVRVMFIPFVLDA